MAYIEKWLGVKHSHSIKPDDIIAFLNRGIQENINLEYKSIRSLENHESLRKEICAFANSEGGLLIVGVQEITNKEHFPGEIEWNNNPPYNKEWFQNVTINQIRPFIPGIRIVSVVSDKGNLFLVDVPQSETPPHMARGGVYYFRNNFQTLPMEHYQVADFFGRRLRPILTPYIELFKFDDTKKIGYFKYGCTNIGKAAAKWPMIHMRFWNCEVETYGEDNFWEELTPRNKDDGFTYHLTHSSALTVIHPNMVERMGAFRLIIPDLPALIKISVAAEDAPTESYAAIISRNWISNNTDSTKSSIKIPLLKVTNYQSDDLNSWTDKFKDEFDEINGHPEIFDRCVDDVFNEIMINLISDFLSYAEEHRLDNNEKQ